jgi:hypothetical protein
MQKETKYMQKETAPLRTLEAFEERPLVYAALSYLCMRP